MAAMGPGGERDNCGRRRLTELERQELLDLPLTAIWSTLTPAGRIHSVPVHFVPSATELRVLTEWDSVKCRNALRTGRATLCVDTTVNGTDRRYATAEGPIRVERPVSIDDLAAFDQRYHRHDAEAEGERAYANSVLLVLTPESWISWSDAD